MKNNYGKMHKQGFNQWRLQNKLRGRNTSAMQDLQTYPKKVRPSIDFAASRGAQCLMEWGAEWDSIFY